MPRDSEKKQNLIAVSDELMQRLQSLQDLYQVDNKPMPLDMLIDRALDHLIREEAVNEQ